MTYFDVIVEYKKQLRTIAEKIKNDLDLFYEQNRNNEDISTVFQQLRDKFDIQVNNFDRMYTVSCPEIISNTPYRIYCVKDSIEIYLDLTRYYTSISDKILEKLPPIDSSLEIGN